MFFINIEVIYYPNISFEFLSAPSSHPAPTPFISTFPEVLK